MRKKKKKSGSPMNFYTLFCNCRLFMEKNLETLKAMTSYIYKKYIAQSMGSIYGQLACSLRFTLFIAFLFSRLFKLLRAEAPLLSI